MISGTIPLSYFVIPLYLQVDIHMYFFVDFLLLSLVATESVNQKSFFGILCKSSMVTAVMLLYRSSTFVQYSNSPAHKAYQKPQCQTTLKKTMKLVNCTDAQLVYTQVIGKGRLFSVLVKVLNAVCHTLQDSRLPALHRSSDMPWPNSLGSECSDGAV